MEKIIEKNINGFDIVIAKNDSNELKIGSLFDFNNKRMKTFLMADNTFFTIGNAILHVRAHNEYLECNIEVDLDEDNYDFPFEFLSKEDVKVINYSTDYK